MHPPRVTTHDAPPEILDRGKGVHMLEILGPGQLGGSLFLRAVIPQRPLMLQRVRAGLRELTREYASRFDGILCGQGGRRRAVCIS